MQPGLKLFRARIFSCVALAIGSSFAVGAVSKDSAPIAPAKTSEAIPWSQIGAKAGGNYKGHGLAVIPTADGAQLRCVFRQLEGTATREGLWLTSTSEESKGEGFRVVATAVGREAVGLVD